MGYIFVLVLSVKGFQSCLGRGSGGGGGGGNFLYCHSMDVRAEWPPFSALPGI